MEIKLDQGLYRHLVFAKPSNSWQHRFELITTPGQLTIRGDMGTYVFSRIDDMAEFFTGSVNLHYWAEKVIAASPSSGVRGFERDLFVRFVLQNFWNRRHRYSPAQAVTIWEDIRRELLHEWVDSHSTNSCHLLLRDFESGGFNFSIYLDVDNDFTDWSAQYIWCCHAIRAGLNEYRAAKAAARSAAETVQAGADKSLPRSRML